MVAKIKDKYLTSADDSIQLRYLLAKDDVDDINFACILIANRLKKELKDINLWEDTNIEYGEKQYLLEIIGLTRRQELEAED